MKRDLTSRRSLLLAAILLLLCLTIFLQFAIHKFLLPDGGKTVSVKNIVKYVYIEAPSAPTEHDSRLRVPNFTELPGMMGIEQNLDRPVYGVGLDDPASAASFSEAFLNELFELELDSESDLLWPLDLEPILSHMSERELDSDPDLLWPLDLEPEFDT